MGGLNWNGNRQPKNWIKNNRLYRVKVKLSYKSEGLERLLFLQLIKEKLTNLDKFPLLEFQKKFPPINMSRLKSWFPPFYTFTKYPDPDTFYILVRFLLFSVNNQ